MVLITRNLVTLISLSLSEEDVTDKIGLAVTKIVKVGGNYCNHGVRQLKNIVMFR